MGEQLSAEYGEMVDGRGKGLAVDTLKSVCMGFSGSRRPGRPVGRLGVSRGGVTFLGSIRSILWCTFFAVALVFTQAYAAEDVPAKSEATQPAEGGLKSLAEAIHPPRGSAKEFVQFMQQERKEDEKYVEQRYSRATSLIQNKDLYRDKEISAFLLTPREKFCRSWNLKRAYDHAFLDIHYGVTISGPYLVGRMTSALDVQPGDKVLEIGTGSGYQSAILSYLTNRVYTIEIIDPLANETDKLYSDLSNSNYPEYARIKRKADDGYYGWEEYAPFDKIIVTCGIDHIPPPLLKQLSGGGVMVIPVGAPGAQVILKVTKSVDDQGNFVITREDIYHGRKKEAFVPFTNKEGGTHYQR
jgi:protein-L-isoaspartate(D-aspartate) O-methyltransferase